MGENFTVGFVFVYSVCDFSFVCFRLYARLKFYSRVDFVSYSGRFSSQWVFMLPEGEFPPERWAFHSFDKLLRGLYV